MEQENKERSSAKNKTTREKLKKARKILHKRIEKKYHRFRVKEIRRKKEHIQLRKKLSMIEYFQYRMLEIINGEWKRIAAGLIILLLLLLIISGCVKAVKGLISLIPDTTTAQETETETETETEVIYPVKDIKVGSTGCMLLHSPFIDHYGDYDGNYDFSSVYQYITPYYSKPDFMTCEFEGALGGIEMGYSGYPNFLSPDIIIENIRDSGVDLQFLATNHIYDGLSKAFNRTMEVYEEKKIAYTGIRQKESDDRFYIADINGVKVGFINYVYEIDGYTNKSINYIEMEAQDQNLINSFSYTHLDYFYKEMKQNIQSMKNKGAQFIIAQMHWGDEYMLEENSTQDEIAVKLCNLGVNALIGGHPHCEQPIDVVSSDDGSNKQMFVIYSEGNALSNQRKELMDEMPEGHTEDGAMITLSLHQDKHGEVTITNIELLPTWVYRYFDAEGETRYFILPLDDVDNIEKLTGIKGILESAEESYTRTMEELGPGLKKALEVFYKEPEPETESETETETETEAEKKKFLGLF